MKEKIQSIKNNPNMQQAFKSLKPDRNIWGFLGIVLFFILPEIVAFMYGEQITTFAKASLNESNGVLHYCYKGLVMLFENGGSWINLTIGLVLLGWLFKKDEH